MKILVIKLGALGDVIMATALIKQIQETHDGADLWLLTSPPFRSVFENWPGLEIQAFPRRGLNPFLKTVAWIRSQGFTRLYDLQSNDRTTVSCALSGVRERVGNHPRYPYTLHPPDRYTGQCHIFERMNAVLASAGVAPAPPRPHLPVSGESRERVRAWLSSHRLLERGFAVMHASASRPAKRWPYFQGLATELAACGLTSVWIGAGPDREVNAALAARAGIDATDLFSIGELAALGRYARFAVTNDSGPMHALAASGIPVYALFGPTNWRRNHALGQADRVLINSAPCRACRVPHGATRHTCLPGITVGSVLNRLVQDGLVAAR